MAYGTRWSIETTNPYSGHAVKALIKERDYSGSVTELDPGEEVAIIRYNSTGTWSGTPHWTKAPSTCEVAFVDDGTGLLTDIFEGDDERFQVLVQEAANDEWTGFVVPDSYQYIPYQRSSATLVARCGLSTLGRAGYLQSGGFTYSGKSSIVEVITQALSPIASGLGIATHCNWYPYIGTDDLDGDDNPLAFLYVDNEIFYDDDGNPFSCAYVLDQICTTFHLQLFQVRNRWHFIQRRRAIYQPVSADKIKLYQYDADATPDSLDPTIDLTPYIEVDGTTNRLVGATAGGTVPYGSVSAVYNHGNPFTDLFSNLSFEEVLHAKVEGTPLVMGASQIGNTLQIDGLSTPPSSIPAGVYFEISGLNNRYQLAEAASIDVFSGVATLTMTFNLESSPADNAAVTFYEEVGNWEYDSISGSIGAAATASEGGNAMRFPVDFETSPFSYSAVEYIMQTSRAPVAGGSAYRIKFEWDVFVPDLEDATTEVYMAFRVVIDSGGTPYYYKWTDSTWTTTATTNEIPLASFGLGLGQWSTFTAFTGTLDDTGTPISGPMTFTFYEGHQFDSGGSQEVFNIDIDNFRQPVIVDENGLPAGEATQTTVTYDGNVNRSTPDTPQLIIGDGPTIGHVRRLTVYDTTGTEVDDITGNWGFGPRSFASGLSLNQFAANEMLKQFRRSCRRLSFGLHSMLVSDPAKPWYTLRVENANNTLTPDYWWESLEYRPASPWGVLSGTWSEFVQGASGDELCEFSVQGSSVAALSLSLEQGLPCASGGDPFNAPFTVLYAAIQNNQVAATHNYVAKISRDEGNVGGWSYELVNISKSTYGELNAIGCLWVDEADGIMFILFTDGNVYSFDLDGNVIDQIYTDPGDPTTVGGTIDVENNKLYLTFRNTTADTAYITEYEYDGTSNGTTWSSGDASDYMHHVAYQNGSIYALYQVTTRSVYRINVSTGVATLLGGTFATGDANTGPGAVDENAGYYFADYIGANDLNRWPIPTASSVTTIENLSTSPNSAGIAVDPLAGKIYFHGSGRNVTRSNYDGSGDEDVIDFATPNVGTYIYGLSTGK